MNDLLRRRRAMMEKKADVLDTSPKIAEYNKCLRRNHDVESASGYCYTEWIDCNPVRRSSDWDNPVMGGAFAADDTRSVFQFVYNGTENYWYYSKHQMMAGTTKIRFTLITSKLRDAYAYDSVTGQIFFAGKNTPYYGYTNINDMPQG